MCLNFFMSEESRYSDDLKPDTPYFRTQYPSFSGKHTHTLSLSGRSPDKAEKEVRVWSEGVRGKAVHTPATGCKQTSLKPNFRLRRTSLLIVLSD